ncbi:hypothetical protein P8C59_001004 [Phyllachora maydis]|uniref:Methyltransferase domain-containing protein n=1 Tax=Phyllachora maydis TaxID=1825666 RepID=A0AAD9MAY1_9PEZI|nr:hypothetical protein P8C59_001004 [Phyllachora maydis]
MAVTHVNLDLDTDELAEAYERGSHYQTQSGIKMLELLRVGPGDAVLDIGTGTGRVARHAAELVGVSGRVLGVDPLARRIAIAQREAAARGLAQQARFAVGDALDLHGSAGVAPASFDAALLCAVLHWLPDPARALREAAAALRPAGRLAVGTGSAAQGAGWTAVLEAALQADERLWPHRDDVRRGMARFHTPAEHRAMFEAAGLAVTDLIELDEEWSHGDVAQTYEVMEASSFGNFTGHVPPELRPRLKECLFAELEKCKRDDGNVYLVLPWLYIVGTKKDKAGEQASMV